MLLNIKLVNSLIFDDKFCKYNKISLDKKLNWTSNFIKNESFSLYAGGSFLCNVFLQFEHYPSITGLVSSVAFMLLFSFLVKKFPKLKKIESFAMPLSMFLGMGMVLLVNHLLPSAYLIEWRY